MQALWRSPKGKGCAAHAGGAWEGCQRAGGESDQVRGLLERQAEEGGERGEGGGQAREKAEVAV